MPDLGEQAGAVATVVIGGWVSVTFHQHKGIETGPCIPCRKVDSSKQK